MLSVGHLAERWTRGCSTVVPKLCFHDLRAPCGYFWRKHLAHKVQRDWVSWDHKASIRGPWPVRPECERTPLEEESLDFPSWTSNLQLPSSLQPRAFLWAGNWSPGRVFGRPRVQVLARNGALAKGNDTLPGFLLLALGCCHHTGQMRQKPSAVYFHLTKSHYG